MQPVRISGNQQRGDLVDERAAHGGVARHKLLILRGEAHGRQRAENLPQIPRLPAVDAGAVGAACRNRGLKGGGLCLPDRFHVRDIHGISAGIDAIISGLRIRHGFDIGPDRRCMFAALHQRNRAGCAMAQARGQHFYRFDDVGFPKPVRPLQDVDARREVEHAMVP